MGETEPLQHSAPADPRCEEQQHSHILSSREGWCGLQFLLAVGEMQTFDQSIISKENGHLDEPGGHHAQ